VQNVVDCDRNSSGCRGGWPTSAFNYMKNHGISDDSKYKYTGATQKCQRIPKNWPPVFEIPNGCEIEVKGNEDALMMILAQIGPVAGIMVVVEEFTSYEGGVFFEEKCRNAKPNHAIVSSK
jgi:hypothetical protein